MTYSESRHSNCDSSTHSSDELRRRKDTTTESDEVPQIGYSLDELNAKREEPKWKVMRVIAIILFWGIWAGLLAGSIIIIVLNNHDVPKSTTKVPITSTILPTLV